MSACKQYSEIPLEMQVDHNVNVCTLPIMLCVLSLILTYHLICPETPISPALTKEIKMKESLVLFKITILPASCF